MKINDHTICQNESGGWYALLPGETEFLDNGSEPHRQNYIGFFSELGDLLEEISGEVSTLEQSIYIDRLTNFKVDLHIANLAAKYLNKSPTMQDKNLFLSAFIWGDTKEGFDFWNNEDDKLQDLLNK